jgi:serine/threonine protein kinase
MVIPSLLRIGHFDLTLVGLNNVFLYCFLVSFVTVSKEARDLVSKMLNPDPSKRINIEEVLKHPWLANRRSSDVSSITQNDTMGDAACTVS